MSRRNADRGSGLRKHNGSSDTSCEAAAKVPAFLGALDALYDVRQWHAADLAETQSKRAEVVEEAEAALQASDTSATWGMTLGEVYDKAARLG